MQEQRLATLQQMLQETPHDPFLIYAIALEYVKRNPIEAKGWFDKLLLQHPDYLPTYYHAAALFIALGQTERAKQVYEQGIELAQQQTNHHALRELRNAYQNLLLELDEL